MQVLGYRVESRYEGLQRIHVLRLQTRQLVGQAVVHDLLLSVSTMLCGVNVVPAGQEVRHSWEDVRDSMY